MSKKRVRNRETEPPEEELNDSDLEEASGGVGASHILPEIDDEVLVTFQRGDTRRPVVRGKLWNGKDKPGD